MFLLCALFMIGILPTFGVLPAVVQLIALPADETKEWHQSTFKSERDQQVYETVKSLLRMVPINGQVLSDPRTKNVVIYVQRIEKLSYETASSKAEYYQLMAQKLHRMQAALSEKRQKRKEQHRRIQLAKQRRIQGDNPLGL